VRSRPVELRRVCCASARWRSGSAGALAPAHAQEASLGLRGETVADAATPLAQPAPIATPDANVPATIAPPVAGAPADGANAKANANAVKTDGTKLPPLKPYPGAQRLGLRGGAADNPRPRRRRRPSPPCRRRRAASPSPTTNRSTRRNLARRSQADPLRRGGRRLGLQSRPDRRRASRQRVRDDRGRRRAAIRLVAQRAARRDQGRLHRLFRRPQRQHADRQRDARRALRRQPRLSFDAEGRFAVSEQTLSSLGLGSGSGTTAHPLSRPWARRSAARRNSAT